MREASRTSARASRERPVAALMVAVQLGCASHPDDDETQRPARVVDISEDFEPAPLASERADAGSGPNATGHQAAAEERPVAVTDLAAATTPQGRGIAATTIATTVYGTPHRQGKRLGYVRLGGVLERAEQPVSGRGCSGFWYPVRPFGFVCTEEATVELDSPLVRATRRRPDLDKPLPYFYGFVRATAPQYLRVPTHAEQLESEFKLLEHLEWYEDNRVEVQRVSLGANDVPLNDQGGAELGLELPRGRRLMTQLEPNELYGGGPGDGQRPFWLRDGRQIPNVSGFVVPDYALFADRVRRKTGLSFVDSFVVEDAGFRRGFAVTVDMRLVPTTKVKPDAGSPFHGLELGPPLELPFAFVIGRSAHGWRLVEGRDEAQPAEPLPHRAVVPTSGRVRYQAGRRFYQTRRDPGVWLLADDIAVVSLPAEWPTAAKRGKKWIDVSLLQQTLVLYRGKVPEYATLVSTGQDRLGDPKTQKATPQGEFQIQSKHVAAAMDSDENSTVAGGRKSGRKLALSAEDQATVDRLLRAEKAGQSLSGPDRRRLENVRKGRHPEYGVTRRRGASAFELRDVPWIQYFDSGFALHGAYWHDVFGIPRSHGCINLSPIDARYVFFWTDPEVPAGWHGINVSEEFGEGTTVVVRE